MEIVAILILYQDYDRRRETRTRIYQKFKNLVDKYFQ